MHLISLFYGLLVTAVPVFSCTDNDELIKAFNPVADCALVASVGKCTMNCAFMSTTCCVSCSAACGANTTADPPRDGGRTTYCELLITERFPDGVVSTAVIMHPGCTDHESYKAITTEHVLAQRPNTIDVFHNGPRVMLSSTEECKFAL